MSPATVTDLLDTLRELHLLEPAQLEAVAKQRTRFGDTQGLAKALISKGWLTPFQVNQLLRGRGADLLVGSYVLLDRLGGGGMGEVFRARNWKFGQLVALKLIRKDRLKNPNAVKRFQREVLASAQLSHPHIVMAIDADQVGQTFYYAMEYVEGADLAKQVKESGPLAVELACEYIRQTALGLQHAHERGLVHRDIKPSNLLVTRDGQVKILDLGLARMDQTDDGESLDTLTQEGAVVGTLDYLAPEQALNSHQVDIRADLYGLGCTFYLLLTGKVPFPGGTAAEKLMKHRLEPPPPLEQLRPEVPAWMAKVVRKLMAKKPEDRYQTPAELALALQTREQLPSPGLQRLRLGRSAAWNWSRRHPRLTSGLALLVLIGLIVFWSLGDQKQSTGVAEGKTAPVNRSVIHPVLGYELKKHPAEAVEFNGHWYACYAAPIPSWDEARRRCQELGGYLACIQTLEEQQFFVKLAGKNRAWLGGFSGKLNKWSWVTGEPFTFVPKASGFPWRSSQPNNEANAFMQLDGSACHDVGSNQQQEWAAGFICEWEY